MSQGRTNAAKQQFPISGVAQVGNPADTDEVLRMVNRRRVGGGKIELTFNNTGTQLPMTVTLQTSVDNGANWLATTDAGNLKAITNEVIVPNGLMSYSVLVRPTGAKASTDATTGDTQLRLLVTGGNGNVQIDGGENLIITQKYPAATGLGL